MVSLFGINLKPKLRNENQNRPGASVAGAPEKGDGQQRGEDHAKRQQQLKLAERFGDGVVTGAIDALIFVHLAHGGYPLGWQVRTVLCAAMKPEQLLGAGCTKEDEHRRK